MAKKLVLSGYDESNQPISVELLVTDDGAPHVTDQSTAGLRNPNSSTTSYNVARKEGRPVILNGQTAVTIGNSSSANDTLLHKIIIGTALVGTLTIDGFEDDGGSAKSFVFPAGTPTGVYDMGDLLNTVGTLQATLSSASDDNDVIIVWSDA